MRRPSVDRGLETAARDEDGGVRAQAIRALGEIGIPTPASTQAILARLEDIDAQVRAAAIQSVGQWGDASEAMIRTILLLFDDANDR